MSGSHQCPTPGCGRPRALSRLQALAAILWLGLPGCRAFDAGFGNVHMSAARDLQDRAAQRDTIVELRQQELLLPAMRAADVDCWILVSEPGNADPLLHLMVRDSTEPSGRFALLVCDDGARLERLAIGRGLDANEGLYRIVTPASDDELGTVLRDELESRNPARIAIDRSPGTPLADGLSASNHAWLIGILGEQLASKLVPSDVLVDRYLGTSLDIEATMFTEAARQTVSLIEETLSEEVVIGARMSAESLAWTFRERAAARAIEVAFPPSAVIQRRGESLEAEGRMGLDLLLRAGDLVYFTAGIRYLGYTTRYGRWMYILGEDERQPPAWLLEGLERCSEQLERIAAGLVPAATELEMAAVELGSVDARIGRVGYHLDGGFWTGPPAAPAGDAAPRTLWRSRPMLQRGALVAIGVATSVTASSWDDQLVRLALIEDAVLGPQASRLVLPAQRAPITID